MERVDRSRVLCLVVSKRYSTFNFFRLGSVLQVYVEVARIITLLPLRCGKRGVRTISNSRQKSS